MVSNEEAADMVIQNLKAKGFEVIDRDKIIEDIAAIRARKLKNDKAVQAMKQWRK